VPVRTLDELKDAAKGVGRLSIAIAVADDRDVLEAVKMAMDFGIVSPILVGRKTRIEAMLKDLSINVADVEVVDIEDDAEASLEAVRLVSSGKASLLMKGMVKTATFLKAVLNKEVGLRTGRILSHVFLIEPPYADRFYGIADGGINMYPTLQEKVQILQNTVMLYHALGYEIPKVAVLAAVEVVNPDMPATVDGAALSKMADRKQIKGVEVDGPLALDNAVSEVAARHKGIESSVAGRADILLVPDIEAGNMMGKVMLEMSGGRGAGLVVGAKRPVVLTSRIDTPETRFLSICLGVVATKIIK